MAGRGSAAFPKVVIIRVYNLLEAWYIYLASFKIVGRNKDKALMRKLQFSIAVLIVWLIFLFNIERLTESVDIRSYTYIFVALVAVVTVILPRLSRGPFSMLLLIPIPIFLVFKALSEEGGWRENLLEGNALPLTVTQISAIILTGLLARQISYGLIEFNSVVANLTFGRIGKLLPSFSEEQGMMYNEVKRARRYQRPLTVIALKIDEGTIQEALPKVIEEVQQEMMQEYIYASLARVLDDNLPEFGTIVRNDNHFIVLLPETTAEDAPAVVRKMEEAVEEKMEAKLKTGTAIFPNDAMTFESLIELAVENADQQANTQPTPRQSQQQTTPQKM